MINKQDLVYFTSPIPTSNIPEGTEPVKLLVTRLMHKHSDIQPGDIIDATNPHIDRRQRWFTSVDGGRTVQGHVLNQPKLHRETRLIAPVTDDLFAYVIMNDRQDNMLRGHVSRWSDPSLPTGIGGDYGLFPLTAPAAPWSRDLMPLAGESEELVRAKVERAKGRWERKQKALRILDQADDRGWGYHIENLRKEWHDTIPVRRYDIEARGRALVPVGQAATPEIIDAARRRIENNGGTFREDQVIGSQYVALEVENTVIGANLTEDEVNNRVEGLFTDHVRSVYSDYTMQAILTGHDTILRSATY